MVKKIVNALTVDLEDWFHPEYISNGIRDKKIEPMIVESGRKTMQLLGELQIRSTFFVNGEIVENHPSLIHEIYEQGHEVASHGFSHQPLWKLTPKVFREELERQQKAIRSVIPCSPYGFRAPSFSLQNNTIWAMKILKSYGYLYDSSVFPVKTSLYGVRGVPLRPYHPSFDNLAIEDENESFIEFPPLAISLLGFRIPTAGGFYFRIFPSSLIKYAIRKTNKRKHPAMLYFHPWELMMNTPRIPIAPHKYFISYFNSNQTEKQIRSLARVFSFGPVREVLGL